MPEWRAAYLDWYVAHSSLLADILPVANTQLGPGSLAAILGGVFEGGEDTIWIHPNPHFTDDITFDPENNAAWQLHKDLLRACKKKAQGHYYVGMPDLMEGLDVLAALKGTDKVLLDTAMQPEVLEHQMQQINDIYFQVYDELYDIIREGDEMAFCYFSAWAPGRMTKLQSDISTMISEADYRRFVQPFIRQQCQKIDYTLYHLDGVGAMRHLPALLEIEELNAIQWTPGVGEPQGGSPKWYDLYKRILAAGKSILASWVTLDELKPLLDNIGADGVHLEMDFHNEREVEQALRIVEEYRGKSSSTPTEAQAPSAEQEKPADSEAVRVQTPREEDEELKPLFDAIVGGKLEPAVEVTRKAIEKGVPPQDIINNYMMDRVSGFASVFNEFADKAVAACADMKFTIGVVRRIHVHLHGHVNVIETALSNDFSLAAQVSQLTLFTQAVAVINFHVFFSGNGKKDHIAIQMLHDVGVFKRHGHGQEIADLHVVAAAVGCARHRIAIRMVSANDGVEFA